MNELQNLVELLDASKTEHILPNDNTAEYNEGYVKGMNVAMNRIKELSLFSVSQNTDNAYKKCAECGKMKMVGVQCKDPRTGQCDKDTRYIITD